MEIFASIFVGSILFFCILTIAAIAALFSERVGIVNIAVDGGMIFAAAFYGIFAQIFSSESIWVQLPLYLVAIIAGIIFSLLQNLLVIKLKADQIIAGIAMNLLAFGIAIIFLLVLGTSSRFSLVTPELALAQNAIAGNWGNILSLKLILTIVIIGCAWFGLSKTKWGLRLKSIGENPQAAAVVGINVNSYKYQGTIISGALSGLAGAIYIDYVGSNFAANVQGLGFLGLAILIIGQWKVWSIVLAGFGFSLLYSLGIVLGTGVGALKPLENYSHFFFIIPYLFTIIVLALTSKHSLGPKAVGKNYDKQAR
ncbi:ABC-type uncharacterized transport system permease subunit [Mycoplasmoides fastidiosum]|uniref:ABC-type uncharacterized transport system permease subunit n=1 Tax=Mycoplasmoides fastidiosum TaxID=92758 RepID=A0ABU0M030_9BACT|nr:ABC transporter permease [Mycoplasmoides fastidiosum]MDQ0514311.1 ABC-type uncharacterized transport system permease subunit [Mycoplasmoides fastidiosum]UUD38085.1 ABC transporter permease [Mycoplasmoides fastidiosum]